MAHVLFVADEIVVNDKNRTAPAQSLERVEFGDHLLIALGARHAPVDFDDVAKLAREWAAARVLHRHRAVAFEFSQMKVGQRSRRQRRPLGSLISSLGLTAGQVFNELR